MKRFLTLAAFVFGVASIGVLVFYLSMQSWSRFSSPAAGIWQPPGLGGPLWELVRFGGQHFAWPAFLASRLGLSNAWVALLPVGTLAVLVQRRMHLRLRWLLLAFAAYGATGWVYFWVLPVPLPHFPHGDWIREPEEQAMYFSAFVRGYREGVSDAYINECFVPEAYSRGKADGLVAGIGERLRVAPMIMKSSLVEHVRKYPPRED